MGGKLLKDIWSEYVNSLAIVRGNGGDGNF